MEGNMLLGVRISPATNKEVKPVKAKLLHRIKRALAITFLSWIFIGLTLAWMFGK